MDISASFNAFIEWIKQLWNKINIKEWAESVGGSSAEAIKAAIYFGLGFAVGFLFKKYFRVFFVSTLIAIALIFFLQCNKILDIDWEALNTFLGFEPTADIGVILNSAFEWVKANIVITISSAVGFLIGYKLG
jgi:uncharacterized membrane protein (Fun14 family)